MISKGSVGGYKYTYLLNKKVTESDIEECFCKGCGEWSIFLI